MAVFLTKKINNITIAIWHIEESYRELLKLAKLNDKEQKLLEGYKNNLRGKQFLATRVLLNKVYLKNIFIEYNKNGAPFLSNGEKISISHSKEWVSIITAKHPVGIDLEIVSKRIYNVKSRFLSNYEQKNILNNDINTLFLYWCAKETMVKITNNKTYIYNKDLSIEPFKLNKSGTFTGFIKQSNEKIKLNFNYEIYDSFVFVWSVRKEI